MSSVRETVEDEDGKKEEKEVPVKGYVLYDLSGDGWVSGTSFYGTVTGAKVDPQDNFIVTSTSNDETLSLVKYAGGGTAEYDGVVSEAFFANGYETVLFENGVVLAGDVKFCRNLPA